MIDVPKLQDAHWAGTNKSSKCTLVLTEGDSAMALAVAGLEVVGREVLYINHIQSFLIYFDSIVFYGSFSITIIFHYSSFSIILYLSFFSNIYS